MGPKYFVLVQLPANCVEERTEALGSPRKCYPLRIQMSNRRSSSKTVLPLWKHTHVAATKLFSFKPRNGLLGKNQQYHTLPCKFSTFSVYEQQSDPNSFMPHPLMLRELKTNFISTVKSSDKLLQDTGEVVHAWVFSPLRISTLLATARSSLPGLFSNFLRSAAQTRTANFTGDGI